ncbi:Protein PAM1 [Nakaseomyces bracarensis]|uniref:Protein PAM1 n=1 Tax=Nakaseomyces bracarensis TaxID=273131 RepID=A0ABR4NQS5_9SACH
MSSLRVLVVGNNPNTLLYASRFQLAKSVDLYHVSDADSDVFEVETIAYGFDRFQLSRHYQSVKQLLSGVDHTVFDLIILSASSLQELSSVAAQLKPVVNSNTKIFLESSGFIQLEPFVKMSMDSAHSNVFSIVSDFDIREVEKNKYKQFALNNVTKNTIWLGECKPAKSNVSGSQQYSKNVVALLETFERLFQKLFPKDMVDLCNTTPVDFLSKQWAVAMPKVCFDPLLIMLEETNPAELNNQIIAKPLISGLVTEVITVARSMGAKLGTNLDNENHMLQYWTDQYCLSSHEIEMPALVYHFIHKTAPLNIDMSLLQIILLADDFGIKTPYLEFLYSVMSQYQKLNEGQSKWFKRVDGKESNSTTSNMEMAALLEEKEQLSNKISNLTNSLAQRDNFIEKLESEKNQNSGMTTDLENQIEILRNELNNEKQKAQFTIQEYESKLNAAQQSLEMAKNQPMKSPVKQVMQEDYKSTGTPNLRDIEDIAVFGVNYNSPLGQEVNSPKKESMENGKSENVEAQEKAMENGGNDELKRRELELRKKELELQERELELQKKAMQPMPPHMQQQQPQQFPPHQQHQMLPQQQQQHMPAQQWNGKGGQPMPMPNQQVPPQQMAMSNSGGNIPQMMNGAGRKPSYPQLQQSANVRNNRNMHGVMPAQQQTASTSNFVDPISSGMVVSNSFEQQPQSQFMPQQQPQPQQSNHVPANVKRTSRKNRHSNMPNIGNASSIGLNNFGAAPVGNGSQSRLNSLSASNLPAMQHRLRQTNSNLALNNINNKSSSRLNMPQPVKQNELQMNGGFQSQQRQLSSSTTMDHIGDISTNSVVHNAMPYQNGNENSMSQPQLQQPNGAAKDFTQSPPPLHQFGSSNNGSPVAPPTAQFSSSQDSGINNTSTDEEEKEGKKKKFGFFKKNKKK